MKRSLTNTENIFMYFPQVNKIRIKTLHIENDQPKFITVKYIPCFYLHTLRTVIYKNSRIPFPGLLVAFYEVSGLDANFCNQLNKTDESVFMPQKR